MAGEAPAKSIFENQFLLLGVSVGCMGNVLINRIINNQKCFDFYENFDYDLD